MTFLSSHCAFRRLNKRTSCAQVLINPHRMHPVGRCGLLLLTSVCSIVCLSVLVTTVNCAKTAEPIEMPFLLLTRLNPVNHVLDGDTYGRQLANTIERSTCSSDAGYHRHYGTSAWRPLWRFCWMMMISDCESRWDGGRRVCTIQGVGLNVAATVSDYNVTIGDSTCAVTSLTATSIYCRPQRLTTARLVVLVRASSCLSVNKVKFSHTRYRALSPELITVYRWRHCRWRELNHAIDPAVGCRYLRSFYQTAPLVQGSRHPIPACYSCIDPERMKAELAWLADL